VRALLLGWCLALGFTGLVVAARARETRLVFLLGAGHERERVETGYGEDKEGQSLGFTLPTKLMVTQLVEEPV
jgi:hypothetical protein